MSEVQARLSQVRSRLTLAKAKYKEVAELFARKGVSEELAAAKTEVDTAEAQLKAIESFERDQAQEVRAREQNAADEAYRAARQDRLRKAREIVGGQYEDFRQVKRNLALVGEAYRRIKKRPEQIAEVLKGFGGKTLQLTVESLIAPIVFDEMLGLALAAEGLGVVAKFTPLQPLPNDKVDANRHLGEVKAACQRAMSKLEGAE